MRDPATAGHCPPSTVAARFSVLAEGQDRIDDSRVEDPTVVKPSLYPALRPASLAPITSYFLPSGAPRFLGLRCGPRRARVTFLVLGSYAREHLYDRCFEEIRRPDRPAHPAHDLFALRRELALGLLCALLCLEEDH
jgi:hypothetical protein